ncbi:MAG TPA: phosphate ABC transporter permease PstA [Nevskiales bacterium]|nr:phosphate ABC transporter permease PstA [Nevskiales bacterium]
MSTTDIGSGLVRKPASALQEWVRSGAPWIWLNAGAVSLSIILVVGLLLYIAAKGMGHFWPADVVDASYHLPGQAPVRIIGEIGGREELTRGRLIAAGYPIAEDGAEFYTRLLVKVGNRDRLGADFKVLLDDWLVERRYPRDLVVVERLEWGNFYGFLKAVKQQGQIVGEGEAAWAAFKDAEARSRDLHKKIRDIEKGAIGRVNYRIERLRLEQKALELEGRLTDKARAELAQRRAALDAEYEVLQRELGALYEQTRRDSYVMQMQDGSEVELPFAKVVRGYRPNDMNLLQKLGFYLMKLWEFVADDPREANTEGGIFPAIFGTVMMVILMSVVVTPFGIVAALYMREYAHQGWLTRTIRIAVNNLAGVPSIVFGVFGLGFFVYLLGSSIDRAFYPEALPSPTFGTPGLLWASLTLALLTLPVVIVATEEGLARIPRAVREASLALGATKAETLWRVVIPMASPAMMTGLILAIARAAGEVAPLMLVGVVKLAPSLPLDLNPPFIHLDRKFMHLGFHIYDVGFQSPNVEAARPLVYATTFLLVLVVVVLNLTAVYIRNNLREKYKTLEN